MLALKAEHISKVYRLGQLNTRSAIQGVVNKFRKNGKVISENDRTENAASQYVYALRDIDFEVPQGQVLGIIGKNGAGKSTLLKILSRITAPTEGLVKIKGRLASLLEVGTGFHPDLSGRENIFLNGAILGMSKREINTKLEEIVEFSGVKKYIDTPVKRYSSGMQVRLAFAVAAHLEPDIMIVDEVLAVGDAEFQEKCIGKMKTVSGEGRTVLFVSHSMSTIRSLCSRGILLKNGSMIYDGSVESCIDKYLQSNQLIGDNGEVPEGFSLVNNGQGRFTRIALTDKNGVQSSEIRYKSQIGFDCNFISQTYSGNVLIGIQIKNVHNENIADFVNVYDGSNLAIKEGENKIHIQLENNFLPGKYYVNMTIATLTGEAIDSIENAGEFTVSNLGDDAENNYPYTWINGYVRGQGKWSIQ